MSDTNLTRLASGKSMGRWRMRARLAAALLAAAAAAGPARAAKPGAPDQRALQARQACADGRVERGVALLAQIVAETGNPNAVYNQARCYQSNGRPAQALARFREFLRMGKRIDPRARADAERLVAELERELESKTRPRPSPPVPVAASQAGGAPAPLAAPAVSARGPEAGSVASLDRSDRGRLKTWRVLALASAGGSALALGMGAYYGWQAKRLEGEIENPRAPIWPADFRRKWRLGQQAEARQWIGYAVAGALLAGSGALHLFWRSASESLPAELALRF